MLPKIETLLFKARASGTPVIYVRHDGPKGHPLDSDMKESEIHPCVAPVEGDQIVRKKASDSFFNTTLQDELAKRGISHLVITGGMTEYCVDTTCRRATSLGYEVTLVADAHLTRDNGVITATHIIAHHNFVLDGFGAGEHSIRVKPTAEITF